VIKILFLLAFWQKIDLCRLSRIAACSISDAFQVVEYPRNIGVAFRPHAKNRERCGKSCGDELRGGSKVSGNPDEP